MNSPDPNAPAAAADNGQPAAEPSLEARLEDAEARAGQQRADFLRAIAELENYRKRAAREIESARQFGVERLAAELLPVADSLAAGIEAAADPATQIEGQRATLRLLGKALERAGISEVDPAGQPFDPALHEAMATRPSAEHPPHTVLHVVQRGYLLNGRLLRPARVIVSTAADTPSEPAPGG